MAWSIDRHAGDAPPVGRDAEAARLSNLIDDAAAGAKRAALLLGVPGIGKSTLLRYARTRADACGIVSSSVRVPSHSGLPPRFPLGELLRGFVTSFAARDTTPPDRLTRVVATLTGATSIEEYAVSLPQIADALEDAGRLGPLGLFVDDYDWAPPEGTELLIAALRVIETPILFIASARLRNPSVEPPSPLPAPTADLWIDHIEVRGLDPHAVSVIAAQTLGSELLPSLTDNLFARTLGNPLFITETLQAWRAEGALVRTGGYVSLAEDSINDLGSLRDMISIRLSRLSDDAISAAGSLAVIGREASFQEIATVCDLSADRLIDLIGTLTVAGFVTSEGDTPVRYRIAHPTYASALLERLGSPRVSSLHERICEVLRQRSSVGESVSASELAHHAVRALRYPPDMRALLSAAATEAESVGSIEEAAVWYGHLAELADDPAELVKALAGRAQSLIPSDPAGAVQVFTYALEIESDPAARSRLLLGRSRAHRLVGALDAASADLEEALPLASSEEVFDVRHAVGVMHGVGGRIDDAEEVFRSLAEETADSPSHWKAIGHLGMAAYVKGHVTESARLQEEAFLRTDDSSYKLYLQTNLSWVFILLGRWDEAETLIASTLAASVAAGDIGDETLLLCDSARLDAWRGNLPHAVDAAHRAIRLATRIGNPADQINAFDALACALLESEMTEDAARLLHQVIELDQPDIEPREFALSYCVLGEACLVAGDLGRARAALARARFHLPNAPHWKIAVDRLEAQIDIALGDAISATKTLREWLDRPSEVVLEQARVLETAGQALLALGDRAEALRRAQEALRIYERLGAARRSKIMGAWLVEHTTRARGRPRSTLPGHLTQRETEILRCIVLGNSNQEIADALFISLGTAKKHVENIMAKAGVSRRTELVPFAVGIGVLALEDLRSEPRRVVRLDRLEPSEAPTAD